MVGIQPVPLIPEFVRAGESHENDSAGYPEKGLPGRGPTKLVPGPGEPAAKRRAGSLRRTPSAWPIPRGQRNIAHVPAQISGLPDAFRDLVAIEGYDDRRLPPDYRRELVRAFTTRRRKPALKDLPDDAFNNDSHDGRRRLCSYFHSAVRREEVPGRPADCADERRNRIREPGRQWPSRVEHL